MGNNECRPDGQPLELVFGHLPGYSLSYGHDTQGRRDSMSLKQNSTNVLTVSRSYDSLNRLTGISSVPLVPFVAKSFSYGNRSRSIDRGRSKICTT
jgi:hypothetical protein